MTKRHLGKDGRNGDKDQRRACLRLKAKGEDCRENRNPCQHGDKQIGAHHPKRGHRNILFITEIAAVGHHGSHTDRQLEKGQPHRGQQDSAVQFAEVWLEQERQSIAGLLQRQTKGTEDQQQDKQQRHQSLGDRLNPLGDTQQQDPADQQQHSPLPQQ